MAMFCWNIVSYIHIFLYFFVKRIGFKASDENSSRIVLIYRTYVTCIVRIKVFFCLITWLLFGKMKHEIRLFRKMIISPFLQLQFSIMKDTYVE